MNTQFKVGQEFKDSKGTVLTVVDVKVHEYPHDSKDTFYTVGFEFRYLGTQYTNYIPQFQIEKLLNSGELTEVNKLSAAERMLEILKKDSTNFLLSSAFRSFSSAAAQQLKELIDEEKTGNTK